MSAIGQNELVIVRHAPADHRGRLCGRTDVAAVVPDRDALAPLRHMLGDVEAVISPALRCRQTSDALMDRNVDQDPRLWEQNFGVDEGCKFEELPDLGTLSLHDLAHHASVGGESFLDMSLRVHPALQILAERVRASGPCVVIAHAGTARAALGLALGFPEAGLKFEIDPLSLTRFRCLEDGLSIVAVNQQVVS